MLSIFRNLPRAIVISMAIVTTLYALVNLSYLTVIGLEGVSASEAVAVVTFCFPIYDFPSLMLFSIRIINYFHSTNFKVR